MRKLRLCGLDIREAIHRALQLVKCCKCENPQFWLHNEGRQIQIFFFSRVREKKNEHLIEQFSSIRLRAFNFIFNCLKYILIKDLLYQYLQEEIIGMV